MLDPLKKPLMSLMSTVPKIHGKSSSAVLAPAGCQTQTWHCQCAAITCLLIVLATLLLIGSAPLLAAAEAEPAYKYMDPKTGFRLGHYRAPTPDSVPNATRITLAELRALLEKSDVALVDVMAHTGAGPDPSTGEWRLSEVRRSIPGSIWLPEVGKGRLGPYLRRYFEDNLEKITGGDKSYPVVFYCLADCWPSWNAAKRAGEWGYENVLWFAEGTDGWTEADLPLEEAQPVPIDLN